MTIKDVLAPFSLSINYVEGIELPIYSLFGVMPDLSDEKIAESAKKYSEYIKNNLQD